MDNNFNEEPNYTGEVVEEPNASGKAKASMICGIIGVVLDFIGCFCCIGYAGIPLSIIAIVMAILSKNETNGELTGQAKVGLICGIAGLVILVVAFVVGFVLGFASSLMGA
ncbi:MAG: DUF4190 domain-containing protein [Lachnospiraceae bacterium]|nr:DUF4190 domain-containing protein [Lachnospiraceae bacterium]